MKKDIFISMDASGKLNDSEKLCVMSGIVFINKESHDRFVNSYHLINERIKCDYCPQDKDSCDARCPEMKSSLPLEEKHHRQLENLIRNEYIYAVVINNKEVNPKIMNDDEARRQYLDYAEKSMVKLILSNLMGLHMIHNEDEITVHLFADQQRSLKNGYYDLTSNITDLISDRIFSLEYKQTFSPLFFKKFNCVYKYRDQEHFFDVQAAALTAGAIRHELMKEDASRDAQAKLLQRETCAHIIFP